MSFFHSPRIVTDGLVLYLDAANSKSYPGSGTDWVNIADTSMTGSITGATFSSNNLGNFTFDETNDYVVISSGSESLNIGTNHTWIWWMKIPDGATGDTFQYLYSHNLVNQPNACNIYIGESSDNGGYVGDFFARYNDTGGNDVNPYTSVEVTSSIADNQWHMVTLVKSGWSYTDHILYIDNTEKRTSWTNNTTEQSITKCVPTGDLNLSRRVDASAARYFGGDIAAFMMYKDKALSEQEVLQNFNALRGRFGI